MKIILTECQQEKDVIGAASLSGKDRSIVRIAEQDFKNLSREYTIMQNRSNLRKVLTKNLQKIMEWKRGLNKAPKKDYALIVEQPLVKMKNSVYIAERYWNVHLGRQMKKECRGSAPLVEPN